MAEGTRTGFGVHQGGPGGYSFQVRYGPSKFMVANVYLPIWASPPSVGVLPEYPAYFQNKGGTWYNGGFDALEVSPGTFASDVGLVVSNKFYGVVITSDYRPGGANVIAGADVERVFANEQCEDSARVVSFLRTIAHRFPSLHVDADRPLTKDPELSLISGTSSGGNRVIIGQMQPDGTFDYSPRRLGDDPFEIRASHCCNPIIMTTSQTTLSGFSKGGTGYSWFSTYGQYSWAGALFGSKDDLDWDDVPMDLKRQMDLGEYVVADNPRAHEVGIYFSSPHIITVVPSGNITNDPTGVDPMSAQARYWRFNGDDPGPIETLRPVVDNVQSFSIASAGAGAGKAKFFRATGSWITDGYLAGDIITAHAFTVQTNGHYLVDSRTATNLIVLDPNATVEDAAAEAGNLIAGGGLYDLHDEANSYIGHQHMIDVGNTRGRLRAGGTDNTNPDPLTGNALADAVDVQDWLETEFGWVDHS